MARAATRQAARTTDEVEVVMGGIYKYGTFYGTVLHPKVGQWGCGFF